MDPVSLSTIETAMLAVLSGAGLKDGENSTILVFDIRRGFATINRLPAVSVALEDIRYEKLSDGSNKWLPGFALYEIFKNPVNEAVRRHGVYPMIEGAVQLLAGSKLGLDIVPLFPEGTTEIVHGDLDAMSAIGFKTVFRTGFDVDRPDDDSEAVHLVTSAIDYYRENKDLETDTSDLSDIITLTDQEAPL
jgi:hypothetical protein